MGMSLRPAVLKTAFAAKCWICPIFQTFKVDHILQHLADSHVEIRVAGSNRTIHHIARGGLTFLSRQVLGSGSSCFNLHAIFSAMNLEKPLRANFHATVSELNSLLRIYRTVQESYPPAPADMSLCGRVERRTRSQKGICTVPGCMNQPERTREGELGRIWIRGRSLWCGQSRYEISQ